MLNQTRALWGIARESPLQGPGIRTEAAPESRVNPAYLRGARRCRAKPEAKPDGLSIAIGGIGSSLHLAGEQLKMMADVRILRLPYKGTAPALTDVLGGQVDLMFLKV